MVNGVCLGPRAGVPHLPKPQKGGAGAFSRSYKEGLEVNRGAVVAALLRYGERQIPSEKPTFTVNPDANAFVISNSFAFLVAVICDQGIPAELAWAVPYKLSRKLGHLDPGQIAAKPAAVAAAVKGPPALHRYVNIVPRWIVAAAERVLREYGGGADAIWGDNPTAAELQRRLTAFLGIGQKKAAMAVNILAQLLCVPISALHGSDIGYDVHIRRVFLRTGLAARDDIHHILTVARAAHPSNPGALDGPAWLIGRQWCHPQKPDCPPCPLTSVCPRETNRAASVKGY